MGRRLEVVEMGDLFEKRDRGRRTGPQALEVQDADTAKPAISMAVRGETNPSIAEASSGTLDRKGVISQCDDVLRIQGVRRDGTIARIEPYAPPAATCPIRFSTSA